MMNSAVLKQLKVLRENKNTRSLYSEGMSKLYGSGVFVFLRSLGRVILNPKDTAETVALNGAYAAGFQDCLDSLLNFEEFYLNEPSQVAGMNPDFGGIHTLLRSGDITDKEADELRKHK